MNQKEFTETQKITQWWLWLLILGVALIPFYGLYQQLIIGDPFGTNPMSDMGLAIFAILMVGFVYFFYMITLKTEINSDEIKIGFFPFLRKTIRWDELESAEVMTYDFVGGWGLRIATKYGTVYNIRGNSGLALVMKSGKKYLIGTQKTDELRSYLQSINK